MTLSRMGIYRGEDFTGSQQPINNQVHVVDGTHMETYADVVTTDLAQFREWLAQKLSDDHGGYWVVTPRPRCCTCHLCTREGDPRTFDVQRGVIVVAWYGTPGLRESVEYGPVLPEKLEELIAGIEQEWFEEDVDEMNWDAIRRDEEPEEGMVEIDMVRRPCELASPWKRHQWQQQYGGE